MADTAALAAVRTPALQQVLASPLYRGSAIALFLAGVGASAAAPQIVLYLVKELGTSLPTAGFYYLTSLAGPVAGYIVGRYSDRTGNRLNLFRLCALAGFIGWALMALSTAVWMPFVIGAVILGFSGATFSQLFAAVHDEQVANSADKNDSVVAIIRMANTAGWIVGPVIGAWVAAGFGLRPMIWLTALCFLAQIPALGTLGRRAPGQAQDAPPRDAAISPSLGEMLPLLAFTALFVLVYAGESIKYGFLLIYMEEQLHIEPAVRGAVIGIQPLIELLIMPFSVVLGRRIGILWLMCIGAALGLGANLCFALWGDVVGMFAGQILMGGVWGFFMVLGIIVAQRLLPNAVATASAIFMSSTALSSALGGIAGGVGVSVLGLPHVYFISAVCSLGAVLGLAAMARKYNFK
jgi:SET family sugar efflux transporter-like MFS transporter